MRAKTVFPCWRRGVQTAHIKQLHVCKQWKVRRLRSSIRSIQKGENRIRDTEEKKRRRGWEEGQTSRGGVVINSLLDAVQQNAPLPNCMWVAFQFWSTSQMSLSDEHPGDAISAHSVVQHEWESSKCKFLSAISPDVKSTTSRKALRESHVLLTNLSSEFLHPSFRVRVPFSFSLFLANETSHFCFLVVVFQFPFPLRRLSIVACN